MDPRSEAQQLIGDGYVARVLEPSPPAVTTEPWFADDPVARDEAEGIVVSPVGTGDLRWVELVAKQPQLEPFAREHWLGPWPRLEELPRTFADARHRLHAVAEQVLKPAREEATGKFGLRFTRGGFGTPFFGDDEQLRVESNELVQVRNGAETRSPIDGVDLVGAEAIGAWFGFAFSVLEELRALATPDQEPSRVQLWPEHFDAAVELGADPVRAAYGCSPGDEQHPEPYVYVAPWSARPAGELWNAQGFPGAELSYAELLQAPDQRACALEFLATRLTALAAP